MPKKKNSKSILIVEDEAIIAEMYSNALTQQAYQVLIAKTQEQAMQMFEQALPWMILLDLLLPQEGQLEPDYSGEPVGLTLLRKIRQHPQGKASKIIVVTNLAEDIHRQKALDLGADLYFIKAQLDPHDLIKKVDGLSK
ncbi:response regulator [Patescibacteria group bacterium]|nr:response regulator [Patescibacteria group bacterium]